MQNNTYRLLNEEFGISEKVLELIDKSEKQGLGTL